MWARDEFDVELLQLAQVCAVQAHVGHVAWYCGRMDYFGHEFGVV